jgi:hypothetical protein
VPVLSTALPHQQPSESSGDIFAREQRLEQLRYLISRGHQRIRWVFPNELPVDGARIPDDVAVMGLDDEPLGRAVTPALTTIAGDFSGFAAAVADAVEAVLAGRSAAALPVPPLRLVQRASA